MRRILFFLFLGASVASYAQKAKTTKDYKVSEESVSQTLKFLTSDELKGRDTGSEGIEMAAKYLEDVFVKNNIKPYFAGYRDTLSNFTKQPAYNIVGYLEGNDPQLKNEFVVIGAHYDHIGMAQNAVNGDNIFNGADDNASGTTAVAEMVNYFAKTKSNKRSVLFCFFSGEEKGLLGSKHLAAKLKHQDFNLYVMFNFEMIGVPMGQEIEAYLTGPGRSNMLDKINEYAGKRIVGTNAFEMKYQLFRASDNYPFYTEFNVPSHTISTTDMDNFAFYHQLDDEFEQMDTKHMTSFIQLMIPVLEKMVNAHTKEIVVKK